MNNSKFVTHFSESSIQMKWLNKGIQCRYNKTNLEIKLRTVLYQWIVWQKWLAAIYNHGHSIESNQCLFPKSIVPECCHLESLKSSLYWVDLNIRECGNLTVLPHRLASKLASMYLYLCQCVYVCLSHLWRKPFSALDLAHMCGCGDVHTSNKQFKFSSRKPAEAKLCLIYGLPTSSISN